MSSNHLWVRGLLAATKAAQPSAVVTGVTISGRKTRYNPANSSNPTLISQSNSNLNDKQLHRTSSSRLATPLVITTINNIIISKELKCSVIMLVHHGRRNAEATILPKIMQELGTGAVTVKQQVIRLYI